MVSSDASYISCGMEKATVKISTRFLPVHSSDDDESSSDDVRYWASQGTESTNHCPGPRCLGTSCRESSETACSRQRELTRVAAAASGERRATYFFSIMCCSRPMSSATCAISTHENGSMRRHRFCCSMVSYSSERCKWINGSSESSRHTKHEARVSASHA